MARNKNAIECNAVVMQRMGIVARVGELISMNEEAVTFRHKKPRSSKIITRVVPISDVVALTKSRKGEDVLYSTASGDTELFAVEGVVEMSTVGGRACATLTTEEGEVKIFNHPWVFIDFSAEESGETKTRSRSRSRSRKAPAEKTVKKKKKKRA